MKKVAAYTLAFLLVAGVTAPACLSTVNASAERPSVVVIGDSIVSGAFLGEGERSFADILQADLPAGAVFTVYAEDGYTSGDVLALLDDTAVQGTLADADAIIVTAGIHDVMDDFMDLAYQYKDKYGVEKFSDLYTMSQEDLGATDSQLIDMSLALSRSVETYQESCRDNILQIGEKLSGYDAQLIAVNVYNSMDTIENFDALSPNRKLGYNSIKNPIGTVLKDYVNAAYTEIADTYGFEIVDAYTAFAGLAYQYTNLADMEADPNAAGHAWIAAAVEEVLDPAILNAEPQESFTYEIAEQGSPYCFAEDAAFSAEKLIGAMKVTDAAGHATLQRPADMGADRFAFSVDGKEVSPAELYTAPYYIGSVTVTYDGQPVGGECPVMIGKKGDADLDGQVSVNDATVVLQYAAQSLFGEGYVYSDAAEDAQAEGLAYCLADVDGASVSHGADGSELGTVDASLILKYVAMSMYEEPDWSECLPK